MTNGLTKAEVEECIAYFQKEADRYLAEGKEADKKGKKEYADMSYGLQRGCRDSATYLERKLASKSKNRQRERA